MIIVELNTDGTVNVYTSEPQEIVVVDHVDDDITAVSMANVYRHKSMDECTAIVVAKFVLGHKE